MQHWYKPTSYSDVSGDKSLTWKTCIPVAQTNNSIRLVFLRLFTLSLCTSSPRFHVFAVEPVMMWPLVIEFTCVSSSSWWLMSRSCKWSRHIYIYKWTSSCTTHSARRKVQHALKRLHLYLFNPAMCEMKTFDFQTRVLMLPSVMSNVQLHIAAADSVFLEKWINSQPSKWDCCSAAANQSEDGVMSTRVTRLPGGGGGGGWGARSKLLLDV